MYPLSLSANPEGWRDFIGRKTEESFKITALGIFKRDHYQCQYCGIVSEVGQEIVNVNGSYTDNDLDNWATACGFCVQCLFLESIGPSKYGGGLLIYLPEMTQTSLNGFCYALFDAMQESNAKSLVAQKAYRHLSLRAELVEKHLGTGMSDPNVLGQLLVEAEQQPATNTFMDHIRLLPSRAFFKEQVANGFVLNHGMKQSIEFS